ncbi:virulence RhuM family protein [bacterium]|nr:virulence RhuM family protein [bacterium]MBU1993210.1 virulence RhuM family protein [bacterium]
MEQSLNLKTLDENKNNIVIYEDGEFELKIEFDGNNVWLRQNEIAEIFSKDRTVITKQINNILKDKEIDEKSNVQKMHIANSDKLVNFYSLDIILAVGYRTNSSKAIKFRQWATKILKQYLINGYVVNKENLQQQKFYELTQTLELIKQSIENRELDMRESKGFVEIISKYARSWALLQGYDEQSLEEIVEQKDIIIKLIMNMLYDGDK